MRLMAAVGQDTYILCEHLWRFRSAGYDECQKCLAWGIRGPDGKLIEFDAKPGFQTIVTNEEEK